ncbi:MAG TPA: DUF1223 domain-containing protein [Thermoanaerobaculia bacterium]|nr:DUF1223 domain-containing protein [Thermoanaerobaculia bacterium]HXT50677.1 DUF1223 domain-containing protein [Thermoanaerobaculia bacterium]
MRAALALLPLVALLACARGDAAAPPSGTPARPVLVELFTSQGCSSCPPADRMLAELAAQPAGERAVVPLAFHVDYWNYIGWTDPFSSVDWSERQRRYGSAFGGGRIYTPELVIAGASDCVGTDGAKLRKLVAKAAAEPERATVELQPGSRVAGSWRVTVRAQRRAEAGAPAAEVLLALYENGLETPVSRGENASRQLHNDRVVRRLVRAATLPAGGGNAEQRIEVPVDAAWGRDVGLVAFVQEPSTLRVLAVAEAAAPSR